MKSYFKNKRRIFSFLTFLIVFSIVLSSVIIGFNSINVSAESWNGGVSAPVNGDGSPDNPYLITNAEEFAYLVKNGGSNKHYKLTSDIYLNDISKINWSNGVAESGYTAKSWYTSSDVTAFNGTIDGDGHIVYGLYMNTTGAVNSALFPRTQNNLSATIKNLGIESAYISTGGRAAGFVATDVGWFNNTGTLKIENSYLGADVTIKASTAAAFYGYGDLSFLIDKCYTLAKITGTSKFGAVGNTWGSIRSISNSYVVNTGISNHNEIPCTNVYTTDCTGGPSAVVITAANMRGIDVLTSTSKMNKLDACGAFEATSSYPVLKVFGNTNAEENPDGDSEEIWNGTVSKPADATGDEVDPILIASAEELAYVVQNGANNKYYKLTTDIYLNDVNKIDWSDGSVTSGYNANLWYTSEDVAAFNGTIDGDGHIVYGLYMNTTEAVNSALFPRTQNNLSATIKNLGIESAYISTGGRAAGFVATDVGWFNNTGTLKIENSYLGTDVTIKASTAAAFYGYGDLSFLIDKCYTLAKITGTSKYGTVGNTWGISRTISNSYVVNTVISNHNEIPCTNVYTTDGTGGPNTIIRTTANMKGQDALTSSEKMEKLASCEAFEPTASYPVLKVFYKDQVPDSANCWDGTVTQPSAGNGTEDNPYIITNAEELAYVVKTGGNLYSKLNNDIYLNDVNKINWSNGKVASGYIANSWYTSSDVSAFNGTIDGDGHIVYGLYMNTTEAVNSALFPRSQNNLSATIKNLGIESAYISTGGRAAGFVATDVGWFNNTGTLKIENSYLGADVTIKASTAAAFYGYGDLSFLIDKCYTLAKITGTSKYGAVGNTWGISRSIKNSYIANTVVTNHGVVNCTNVYTADVTGGTNAVARTAANMQGLDVLTNGAKMSDLADCDVFFPTDTYPILKIFSDVPIEDDEEVVEGTIWSGKVAKKFASGMGTENDPYIITNGAELAYAVKNKGFEGSYFKLSNDIYLNDVTNIKWAENSKNNPWVTSTGFNGHIDGCGFIVYGLWYEKGTTSGTAGLIPVFNKGSIKNLGVRYASIEATANAGGIVGITTLDGLKTIDKCFVDESVTVQYTTNPNGCAGGIIGQAGYEPTKTTALIVSNCYSKAKLYGNDKTRTNGIIGTAWQCSYKINNCYSKDFAPYSALHNETCSNLKKEGVAVGEIYKNIYTDAAKPTKQEVFEYISDSENMIGDKAKKYMSGLDFENVFQTVTTSTPKLKIFKSISGEDVDITGDSQAYESGKGTKSNPFIIANAEQLRYLLESENTKGKYYELACDIYINDTSKANWKVNNPSLWYTNENSKTFAGYIEGNGYSIYGLFMNQTPNSYDEAKNNISGKGTGLFPRVSTTAVIRNIHIRNSYLSSYGYVGSIAGRIMETDNDLYAQIVGCSADETVELKGQITGGIIAGWTDRGLKIHYCYFTGKVSSTAPSRANSLVGDIWGSDWEMLECYGVGYPAYRFPIKPKLIAATYGTASIDGCKTLTLEKMIGEKAKENMKDFEWDIWKTVENGTPEINVVEYGRIPKVFDEGVKGRVWSGYRATKYAGGDGTKENPYLIETPEQMALLVTSVGTSGKYYKLMADLKLNDTSFDGWEKKAKEWFAGTTEFAGHFDGNGYVVSGMYFNTAYSNVGLFQRLTSGAVIEKVGVTKSYIYNFGEKDRVSYAGALVGTVAGWEIPAKKFVTPKISMCFADHTVTIDAYNAGGLIGGCGTVVDIDNCYFTGRINSEGYGGQAIADAWNSATPSSIKNSYFVSDDGKPVADHPAGAPVIVIENVYQKGKKGYVASTINVASMQIRGKSALEKMPKLDYENVWKIVEGGTPVLRCFKNAESYSCTVMPQKVEISFASQGGSACESLFGYPLYDKLTKDMLPTPTRYGYEFGGWYYFSECYVPVEDGLFPDFSTVFYAKWIPQGFTVDFEGTLDAKYDFNKSAEHYKPGASSYSPLFVNKGLKSMHAKSGQQNKPLFLLSYENTLEVGQVYDIEFWVTTDDADVESANLKLFHANHPQVDSDIVGFNTVGIKEIKNGQWQKVKTQITANTPYLLFETDNESSIYFDDIQVVPVGKSGELGKLEGINTDASVDNDNNIIIIIGVVSGTLVLLAAVLISVYFMKKRKNK